jgi:hypothetical protein
MMKMSAWSIAFLGLCSSPIAAVGLVSGIGLRAPPRDSGKCSEGVRFGENQLLYTENEKHEKVLAANPRNKWFHLSPGAMAFNIEMRTTEGKWSTHGKLYKILACRRNDGRYRVAFQRVRQVRNEDGDYWKIDPTAGAVADDLSIHTGLLTEGGWKALDDGARMSVVHMWGMFELEIVSDEDAKNKLSAIKYKVQWEKSSTHWIHADTLNCLGKRGVFSRNGREKVNVEYRGVIGMQAYVTVARTHQMKKPFLSFQLYVEETLHETSGAESEPVEMRLSDFSKKFATEKCPDLQWNGS